MSEARVESSELDCFFPPEAGFAFGAGFAAAAFFGAGFGAAFAGGLLGVFAIFPPQVEELIDARGQQRVEHNERLVT